MKYFIDTEFIEQPNTIELISIGIVAEDGREYYAVHTECDCTNADDWVKENVLKKIPQYNATYNDLRAQNHKGSDYPGKKTIADIKREILQFCGQNNNVPEQCKFYGYYADYDWVIFCWIFGKMINLPKGFPMYCRDLKQIFDDTVIATGFTSDSLKAQQDYPKQNNEHNALDDAKWNFDLYKFLQTF